MPVPQPGDTNIKGYMLPRNHTFDVEALESIYGQQPTYAFNPLCFYCNDGSAAQFAPGTEVYFDLVAAPIRGIPSEPTAYAVNFRAR